MAEKPSPEDVQTKSPDRLAEFPDRFAAAVTKIHSGLASLTARPTEAVEAMDGWAIKLPVAR
jgi:hypothetical protein